MVRPLRIEYPGALYHVMSRGNAKGKIVRDDRDRDRRLEWLCRTIEMYGWRLHAFAILGNHEHLFVETPRPNLSAAMQYLNGSYTGYFNVRHRRVGHLFEGRYKAHLIENVGHYGEISRYIHLNPVRAGLVGRPEDWPWTSYRGYCRASRAVPWITYDPVLDEFGPNRAKARRAYARFVAEGLSAPPSRPWERPVGGLIIGGERFIHDVRVLLDGRPEDRSLPSLRALRRRPTLDQIATVAGRRFQSDPKDWVPGRRIDDLGRAVATYLARRRFGYRAAEIASGFGYKSHGGVGGAVQRIESASADLHIAVEQLVKQLSIV